MSNLKVKLRSQDNPFLDPDGPYTVKGDAVVELPQVPSRSQMDAITRGQLVITNEAPHATTIRKTGVRSSMSAARDASHYRAPRLPQTGEEPKQEIAVTVPAQEVQMNFGGQTLGTTSYYPPSPNPEPSTPKPVPLSPPILDPAEAMRAAQAAQLLASLAEETAMNTEPGITVAGAIGGGAAPEGEVVTLTEPPKAPVAPTTPTASPAVAAVAPKVSVAAKRPAPPARASQATAKRSK